MTKQEKLSEIKKLWTRRDRIEPWENLKWEADVNDSEDVDPQTMENVHRTLKYHGHVIDILDGCEIEVAETPWDEFLLKWLRVWYYLGKGWEVAPIFINETAEAVAIAGYDPERFDLLFYHPHCDVLGLEHWEKETRETNAQIHKWQREGRRKRFEAKDKCETADDKAKAEAPAVITPVNKPLNREAVWEFLNK